MLVNVADLIGPTLDYAVADALGYSVWFGAGNPDGHDLKVTRLDGGEVTTLYAPGIGRFSPSNKQAVGGSLIDTYRISTRFDNKRAEQWEAYIWTSEQHGMFKIDSNTCTAFGPTRLIAAMRCLILRTIAKDGTVVIPDAMFEKPDY